MTQAPTTEVMELAIVACETCDGLFLKSPRRDACPTCGGSAGLTFFEFEGDETGLKLKDAPALAAVLPVDHAPSGRDGIPQPAGAESATPDQPHLTVNGVDRKDLEAFLAAYLTGLDITGDNVKDQLVTLGVEPQIATHCLTWLDNVRQALVRAPGRAEGDITPEPTPAADLSTTEPAHPLDTPEDSA
jgi:hypothetical protein